jgi:aryl-alcohol dehydrogenase-like predicted oxidoreductase
VGVLVFSPLNGGWLSGKYRRGEPPDESSRAARHPDYFDFKDEAIAGQKLRCVEQLERLACDAGLTLLQLGLGFVLSHRAVTSAIIGPRTHEQLTGLLSAVDVRLSDDVLDRIDRIVPPGRNINPEDSGWTPPALRDTSLRRIEAPRP